MKMYLLILLLFIKGVNGIGEDGDTKVEDDEVKNLLRQLNDELDKLYSGSNVKGNEEQKKAITSAIKDAGDNLKEEQSKSGNSKSLESALEIMGTVKDNLEKLKSDDPYEIIQGGLAIAIAIGSVSGPVGETLVIVGTAASTILSMFTPEKSETDELLEGFKDILLVENDQTLKQRIAAEKTVITTALAVLKDKKKLTASEIRDRKIETTTGDRLLGELAARMKDRGKDGSESSGSATFHLAIEYVNFATYRDIAVARMMALLANSGRRGKRLLEDFQKAAEKHKTVDYKEHLQIFYKPDYEYIDVLANYHPPKHNTASKLLTNFLEKMDLPSPPVIDTGEYVVKSVEWPKYYLDRKCRPLPYVGHPNMAQSFSNMYNCFIEYKKDHPARSNRIRFIKQPNGYFRMIMLNDDEYKKYKYVSAKRERSRRVRLLKTIATTAIGGDILVLKFGDQVTFSNSDKPTEYWNGRAMLDGVVFRTNKDGYKDGKKFELMSCPAKTKNEKCPDW